MPHIETLEPKSHSFRILFGQRPLTRFTDYRKAIKVDLIEPEPKEKMMKRIYDFVKATWSEDGRDSDLATTEEMQDALTQMLSGKALGLGLETVNFTFRISGISRVDTHQIVRQRIGVTFSQQCTGDRFLTHNDALVEECIAKSEGLLTKYIDATLRAKDAYACMNDHDISIQAARAILPHNLSTFIFMNTNLATLMFFYQKRIDDGSQTWQINEIARQMGEEVCKMYPELAPVFEKAKTKFKFQKEAGADRKNTFSTSLYLPKIDEYDYHNRDFLYPKNKEQMHFTGTPINDTFYWGNQEISEEQYDIIKSRYSAFDRNVHENHWSNQEIQERAEKITRDLEKEISLINY